MAGAVTRSQRSNWQTDSEDLYTGAKDTEETSLHCWAELRLNEMLLLVSRIEEETDTFLNLAL